MFSTPTGRALRIVGVAAIVCAALVILWKRPRPVPDAGPATSATDAFDASPVASAPQAASSDEIPEPLPPAQPFHGALDCKGIGPQPPLNCPVPTGPLPDLVRAGNQFFMSGGGRCGFTQPLTGPLLETTLGAVRAAAGYDWSREPAAERIVGQNAALRLALCAQGSATAELRRQSIQVVQKMALPAQELVSMGSDPVPEVRAWLGDPSVWQDLRSRNKVPLHELGYARTKAVRAVIVGDMLANVGQLVAIDTEWKPHITPLVGSLEIRRPYKAENVTVCAASLDVGWLRCGAPAGLRTFAPETDSLDPQAPVMFRTDQARIPCRGCHLGSGRPKSMEVSIEEGRVEVQNQRASLLADVAERLDAIRKE
jgi:hypothetical protein